MLVRFNFLNQGWKPGFWTGVVAFMCAKVVHLTVTFLLGFIIGSIAVEVYGYVPQGVMTFAAIIDSIIIGLIFLVIVTRWFYLQLIKKKDD